MAGLLLAMMLASLDQNIVATALPRIVAEFGGLRHLSWVVTAFVVASTTTTPLYGEFGEVYGRRNAFFLSISVFLLGSALCGLAGSLWELIGFRCIQGLGAGGLMALSQTVVGDLVAPRDRGRYQGLISAVFATCSVGGPLLGGALTTTLSWRWIFYVNLPVGLAAIVLIAVGLEAGRRRENRRIDGPGAVALVVFTSAAMLALSLGGTTYAWTSPIIFAMATAAALALFALVLIEGRVSRPLLPVRLLGNATFVLGAATTGLAGMALFAALVFLPLFFQLVRGADPTLAGLEIAPMMGGVIVASTLGGRIVAQTGRYKALIAAGLGLATASFGDLAWNAATSGAGIAIETDLVTLGLGIGVALPNLTTAIQNAVERADMGAATAMAVFCRSLGGALGVAVAGAIVASRLAALSPGAEASRPGAVGTASVADITAYAHALSAAFTAGAIICTVAVAFALLTPERPLAMPDRG